MSKIMMHTFMDQYRHCFRITGIIQMVNKVYADGKGPTYGYAPDGKLAQRTWARGITTDYSYDGWGNLTNTVYS